MNKKISDMFDYGADISAGEAKVSFDPACIKEMTMKKINEDDLPMKGKRKMKMKTKRIVFLAAAIAVALMCSAFAFYKFGVRDLLLPEEEPSANYTRISVTGWRDSPEYLAFTEWSAYETDYNSTREIPNVVTEDIPIEYQMAGAWSKEMKDTLDGILDKYGLKLHDSAFISIPAKGSGVDVEAMLPGGKNWAGGYAYSDGTLRLDAELNDFGEEAVTVSIFSAVKGTFTNISGAMSFGEDYEEWEYTAADGTPLALALSGKKAVIVADMERSFICANVAPVENRAELEAAADIIGWKLINAYEGYSAEFYEAYAAELEKLTEEDRLACAAENEFGRAYGVTAGVAFAHDNVIITGRASEASEDSFAWLERRFIHEDSDAFVSVRYQRCGDAQAALRKLLSDYGMTGEPETIADVPVCFAEQADGALRAVWYDEDKALLFTLTASAGELTKEKMDQQVLFLLTGEDTTGYVREPIKLPVADPDMPIPEEAPLPAA